MPQTQESTAVDAAAPPSHSNLAPDTGAPLSRSTLIRFGVGFFGISLLWAIGLNTVASVLLPQRLKDIGVDNPTALLGSISAVTALVSLPTSSSATSPTAPARASASAAPGSSAAASWAACRSSPSASWRTPR